MYKSCEDEGEKKKKKKDAGNFLPRLEQGKPCTGPKWGEQ